MLLIKKLKEQDVANCNIEIPEHLPSTISLKKWLQEALNNAGILGTLTDYRIDWNDRKVASADVEETVELPKIENSIRSTCNGDVIFKIDKKSIKLNDYVEGEVWFYLPKGPVSEKYIIAEVIKIDDSKLLFKFSRAFKRDANKKWFEMKGGFSKELQVNQREPILFAKDDIRVFNEYSSDEIEYIIVSKKTVEVINEK